jgi:hypothetical protein
MTRERPVGELRLEAAALLYGPLPSPATAGEVALSSGAQVAVMCFPGAWLGRVPVDQATTVVLRDAAGTPVRTIDLETTPHAVSYAPVEDEGRISSRASFLG